MILYSLLTSLKQKNSLKLMLLGGGGAGTETRQGKSGYGEVAA